MVIWQKQGRQVEIHEGEGHEPNTAHETGLPFEKFAKLLMNGEAFVAYVKKHGYHFSPELADHVTAMMENADGSTHHWTSKQVKEAMQAKGMTLAHNYTWGDAAYQANMGYADYYPDPVVSEQGCLKYAAKTIHDPDGYDGMIFCRWLSDVVAKEVEIDWEAFV